MITKEHQWILTQAREDQVAEKDVAFRLDARALLEGIKDAIKPAGIHSDTFDLHPLNCVSVEL